MRRIIVIVGLLLLLGAVWLLWESQAQPCPAFAIGEIAVIRSGDVFEGRRVEVFQPGFTTDGAPVYVVRLLTDDPPPARGGYIAATGCELSRE